jgi:uncharacterized pyridoxal phosphate-containing UPF0001 family protein
MSSSGCAGEGESSHESNSSLAHTGVANLAVVESVHTLKIASALEKACESCDRKTPLDVMVQVASASQCMHARA